MTWFGIKWPEKGWYAVKQNNQPTNLIQWERQMMLSELIDNRYPLSMEEWEQSTSEY